MEDKLKLKSKIASEIGRYMVFAEKGALPKHIHASFEEARKEAEYIASNNYPQWVRILRIEAEVKATMSVSDMPLPEPSSAKTPRIVTA